MTLDALSLTLVSSPDLSSSVRLAAEVESMADFTGRLMAGDDAAWREFHALYFDRLLRYLVVVAFGEEDAAREALQATFVKAVRRIRRFESEEAFWNWLACVARHSLIDLIRREKRHVELLRRFASAAHSCSDSADEAEQLRGLEHGLAELDPADRELLEARYEMRRSLAEIADESGTTPKAVESRLARVRERLRTWLIRSSRHEN